jgi:hypothetical protein
MKENSKPWLITVLGLGLLLAVAMPSSAALKEGMWIEDTNVGNAKSFNAWELRIFRAPIWRYYPDTAAEYYDNVRAVVHLFWKTGPAAAQKNAVGDLVFLHDNEPLPSDLSIQAKGKIVLFYPYSQFAVIVESLESHKAGSVELLRYYEKKGEDQIMQYAVGQLRF